MIEPISPKLTSIRDWEQDAGSKPYRRVPGELTKPYKAIGRTQISPPSMSRVV